MCLCHLFLKELLQILTLFDRPKDATRIYLVTNCFLKSLHLHLSFWHKLPFLAQHCQTELLWSSQAWLPPDKCLVMLLYPLWLEACSIYLTSHSPCRGKLPVEILILVWPVCAYIHMQLPRMIKKLVIRNVTTLPRQLLESNLNYIFFFYRCKKFTDYLQM